MKELPRILAAYVNIDVVLETELVTSATPVKVKERQVINDQAYFLLCWGQLEFEIDQKCRATVKHRRDHADWWVRRGWDLFNPDDPRFSGLSFENRAKLVLDANEGRGRPYALTMKHYSIRNGIAHGKLQSIRIEVSAFVQDCFTIQAALHRAA